MRASRSALLAMALLGPLAAGCARAIDGDTVAGQDAQRVDRVDRGVVMAVRPVKVQDKGGIGTVAGAVAGGVAGSYIGGDWRSNALAGLGGALVGGLIGNQVDKAANSQTAFEYVIRGDDGRDYAVVQGGEVPLAVGQRVLVLQGPRARVIADTTGSAPYPGRPGPQGQFFPQGQPAPPGQAYPSAQPYPPGYYPPAPRAPA